MHISLRLIPWRIWRLTVKSPLFLLILAWSPCCYPLGFLYHYPLGEPCLYSCLSSSPSSSTCPPLRQPSFLPAPSSSVSFPIAPVSPSLSAISLVFSVSGNGAFHPRWCTSLQVLPKKDELNVNLPGTDVYPLDFQAQGVLSLPASAHPSVCPSVCKLFLVCMTTHRFELESPHLLQAYFLGYSRLVLKMEVIYLDLQGNCVHLVLEFYEIRLVRAITVSRISATITKFAPNMHPGILSAIMENGGHWPWPSRSLGHHSDSRNCIHRCSCILT